MTKDSFVTESIISSIILKTVSAIAKYNPISNMTKSEIIYKELQNNIKTIWDKGNKGSKGD